MDWRGIRLHPRPLAFCSVRKSLSAWVRIEEKNSLTAHVRYRNRICTRILFHACQIHYFGLSNWIVDLDHAHDACPGVSSVALIKLWKNASILVTVRTNEIEVHLLNFFVFVHCHSLLLMILNPMQGGREESAFALFDCFVLVN